MYVVLCDTNDIVYLLIMIMHEYPYVICTQKWSRSTKMAITVDKNGDHGIFVEKKVMIGYKVRMYLWIWNMKCLSKYYNYFRLKRTACEQTWTCLPRCKLWSGATWYTQTDCMVHSKWSHGPVGDYHVYTWFGRTCVM